MLIFRTSQTLFDMQSLFIPRITFLLKSKSSKPIGPQFRRAHQSINSMEGNTGYKIQGPNYDGIFTEPFKSLVSIFDRHGFELRIAGGAVRDLLYGIAPHDIDLATPATPQEMKEFLGAENIRMINEQGEKHGTVTVRMLDKENYEITTLRIDKVTDGRHAEVEFTRDWLIDAERRDLTVNSMFMGLDGTLYDYFGGRSDLENRRIVFVGSATKRIQEDYLRILRYFRFYGRLVPDTNQHEEETLKAIRENVEGMKRISGERIWSEWKKILSGNFGGHLTLKMIEVGLAPYIGLPETPNIERMEKLINTMPANISLHPITLLTTLLDSEKEMMTLHNRLKLSGFERDMGLFILANQGKLNDLKTCQYKLIDTKSKIHDCKEWIQEVLKLGNKLDLLDEINAWEMPKFPVNGLDLKEASCPQGKVYSFVLDSMKEIWKKSDYKSTKEELMAELHNIVEDYQSKRPTSPKRPKIEKTK